MLNEFLGVSRKLFRANFILMSYDSALQTVGLRLDRPVPVGRRDPW